MTDSDAAPLSVSLPSVPAVSVGPSVPDAPAAPAAFAIGARRFEWGVRTYLMGVVNATPDSFSGDGVLDPGAAAEQAQRMVEEGADLLDIGAQSTRPGHAVLPAEEEWSRLGPVLAAVRRAVAVPLTVDTSRAVVAERAFAAGADALNDVHGLASASGGPASGDAAPGDATSGDAVSGDLSRGDLTHGDPALPGVLARSGLPAVLMHNQRDRPRSGDPIADVRAGLSATLRTATEAGVDTALVVLDPGFGFGWEPAENLLLLRRLGELRALGRPLLIGTSRKSTIGAVLDRSVGERLWGTAATVALAVAAGVDIVRVHDVRAMADVARMADAVVRIGPGTSGR